jgi:glycosyltransferase involved in cell wall biosynthesis
MKKTNTPTKILFCIDKLIRGGTELQLIGLIERLDPEKFQPYLLTIRETEAALVPSNCQHLPWSVPKLFSLNSLKHIFKLISWLKNNRISIVQTYFQDATLFAGISSKLASTPIRIACFRDMAFWNNSRTEKALRKIYPYMTDYISNSVAVSEHFAKQFNLNSQKIKVMPNGINISKFNFVEHDSKVTDICIVGNMTRQVKRTDLFIKSAAIVAKTHPHITWHIIGEGHLKPDLLQLAKDLKVEQQVKFVGRISNVAEYMESIQLGVLCSDSEGLSNAILEYMLKGVVCVARDVGGTPEIITDGESGFLVKKGDEFDLANRILFLLVNPELMANVALNARQEVEAKYSWSNCVSQYENFYKSNLMV